MAQPSHGLAMGRKTDIVRHTLEAIFLPFGRFPKKKSLITQA